MNVDGRSRNDVELEANRIRSKLLHTVEQLDQRRHDALDLKRQVRRHVPQVAVLVGAVVLVTAAATWALVHRAATAVARRRRARWHLAKNVWSRPTRTLRAGRGPFYLEALRSIGLSLVTMGVAIPARRTMARLVDRSQARPPVC